ncbi:CHRD domain-containing protein [Pedobacter aquatilis]|uniref:CHRD domain-containing protein n=1 Tax=Pedobacter aquatilis TaxID=351343 RepID=UPI00292DEB56|nr:CHRD domain-containing protein [Pedobacter aquatilis]
MKCNLLTRWLMLVCIGITTSFFSCKKEEPTSDIYTLRQWKSVELTPASIVPAISGRTDHAVAVFYLMTDNKLHYYIYFDKPLNNSDTPGQAVIYTGVAGTAGTVLINLNNSAFDANREVKGAVDLSASIISELNTKTVYLQISSAQQASGLVRGQLTSY